MGKKANSKGANLSVAPALLQKELYQRVNFALQSSTFLQSLAESSSERKGKRRAHLAQEDQLYGSKAKDERPDELEQELGQLARGQMHTTRKMAAHTQLKLDPSVKRAMCGQCNTFLIPGLTARIRNRSDKRTVNAIHTTCLQCHHIVVLPAPPTNLPSDPSLDGPIRKKRREKVIARSKVAFHSRERSVKDDNAEGDARKGHSLWADDKRVTNWGETATAVVPADTSAIQAKA